LFIAGEVVTEGYTVDDLRSLLDRRDGFVWVDISRCHQADREVRDVFDIFGFHDRDVQSCMRRNHVQKVHSYPDYLFFVLFGPKLKREGRGHIHFLELSQFVGDRYLVTVHAFNPTVAPEDATIETRQVCNRLRAGTLRAASPWGISCEIVKHMTMHMEDFIECSSRQVWQLQQCVMAAADDDSDSESLTRFVAETAGEVDCQTPAVDSRRGSQAFPKPGARRRNSEPFLEALFRTRHGLITVRSMAALSEELYGRLVSLPDHKPSEREPLLDVAKRFKLLEASAAVQQDYLQGVVDHYRARTDTKRTLAAISLAVIAVVTLPITALASIYGMNIINNQESDPGHLAVVLTVMALISAWLLGWAVRRGWFRW
jgi:Mg2+ and Co2+ transporter CorA